MKRANDEQVAKDLDHLPESEFSEDDPPNQRIAALARASGFKPSRATSLVIDPPDGRLPPITPRGPAASGGAVAARAGRGATVHADFTNYDRCITRGVTGSILPAIYGNGTQILQAPGFVVIRTR